ncbi:hypothetical protein GCM10025795_43480 [Verticiella sediminum]
MAHHRRTEAAQHGLQRAALVALADAAGFRKQLGYAAAEPGLTQPLQKKLAGYGEGACYMGRELRPG